MVGVVVPEVVREVVGVDVAVVVVAVVVAEVVGVLVPVLVTVVVGVVISQPANVPSSNDATIPFSSVAAAVQSSAVFTIPPNVQEKSTVPFVSPREYSASKSASAVAESPQVLLF